MGARLDHLESLATRWLFGAGAIFGLRLQRRWLIRVFEWRHRKADPWQHAVDPHEQYKYARTVAMLPPGRYARVLEIGCSEGHLTAHIAQRVAPGDVLAIDISPRAIMRAQATYGHLPRVTFAEMDILSATPPGEFDAIFCSEVLYYLGASVAVCRQKIERLLRPGGALVLCHGWPVDEALHQSFAQSPAYSLHRHVVDEDPVRPFVLTALQRRGPGEGAIEAGGASG